MVWKLGNGGDATNYINFAASLTSLILAIVAIFFAIVKDQSATQQNQQVNDSLNVIVSEIRKFSGLVNTLEELTKNIDKIQELSTQPSASIINDDPQAKLERLMATLGEIEKTASSTTTFNPYDYVIKCPYCLSTNIDDISNSIGRPKFINYRCIDCGKDFSIQAKYKS
jgi:predicted PurR-regulated permease PerM